MKYKRILLLDVSVSYAVSAFILLTKISPEAKAGGREIWINNKSK
jgi:hypothetical protein